MTIGKRIKRARLKTNTTLPRLAQFIGIDERKLILIENERRKIKAHEMELAVYFFRSKGLEI